MADDAQIFNIQTPIYLEPGPRGPYALHHAGAPTPLLVDGFLVTRLNVL